MMQRSAGKIELLSDDNSSDDLDLFSTLEDAAACVDLDLASLAPLYPDPAPLPVANSHETVDPFEDAIALAEAAHDIDLTVHGNKNKRKLPDSNPLEGSSFKLFHHTKRLAALNPRTRVLEVKAKFVIDEQQKILLSVHRLISATNYSYNRFTEIQLAWLQGKKVTYLGQEYRITPAELNQLIEMIAAYMRATLFVKLCEINTKFLTHVFQMPGEKLYSLFCQLINSRVYKSLCMEIWLKSKHFVPWLKQHNNEKLIELFILNSTHSSPYFSAFLMENYPEIGTWYHNCQDIPNLTILFNSLMFYPENLFNSLMGKNSPLEKLFISFTDEQKLTHLFHFTTITQTTKEKFSAMLDLIHTDLLKNLLHILETHHLLPRKYILPLVLKAIAARGVSANPPLNPFRL